MAQKNATPNKAQQEVLKKNNLNPMTWVVIKDMEHGMIVKHRITGEFSDAGQIKKTLPGVRDRESGTGDDYIPIITYNWRFFKCMTI